MAIQLSKQARKEAMASIISYFHESREEEIGAIAAGGLLDLFMTEIAPSIYNKAVSDVLDRLRNHISELDIDLNEEEFPSSARRQRRADL
ncbi:DUF2164 domain-containing protein [Synechococcus sp. CS-602]|uniref:DUF2164 domain-containing protein n=1 Tax=Synechococcaceae TaxID=1890426 RepID=UPI00223BEE6D|nr:MULTISPECIES: DUF2164 domain-containing protein [Synechococcaceae]MCT0205762.1 DUF2164 domain-containing protein [Synechococcus sp. CS-602]MCT4368580.1 DUF2164 domain-containing protein [Candidatus Regnicoccus frigidus MAG-AL2]